MQKLLKYILKISLYQRKQKYTYLFKSVHEKHHFPYFYQDIKGIKGGSTVQKHFYVVP